MSFVTVDFPDIRESDSAEYAYLANVYNTTYSHNQNAWRSPDENRLDGTTYAAWWLMDEYYTRGEHAMIGECRRLLTKRCRACWPVGFQRGLFHSAFRSAGCRSAWHARAAVDVVA